MSSAVEAMLRGYSDVVGGKLDASSGWPACHKCMRQLPKNCVYCCVCRQVSVIDVPGPRQAGGGLLFIGSPGMAAAMTIGDAVLRDASRRAALARAVGIQRSSWFVPGALVIFPLFFLSSQCNQDGLTFWSYLFGIMGILALVVFWALGTAAKESFAKELAARVALARAAYGG